MDTMQDLILKPVRIATSKPARQTYLNTVLFTVTSLILLGLAVLAYIVFYYSYVPQIGIEHVIHLQYGDGPHPYGITTLDTSLISQQPYDVSLALHLPRSLPNIQQGNFMLSLSLLSASYTPLPVTADASSTNPVAGSILAPSKDHLLLSSRRPAILTYTSRFVSLSERLFALPLYIMGLKDESEVLHVPMAESTTFPRGRKNIPAFAVLELQAGQEVQVYGAKITFTARFGGLRWIMYNHRIISFLLFTGAFWIFEVLFAILGWLTARAIFAMKAGGEVKSEEMNADASPGIKNEDEESDELDLSDTPRTFPTYGRQAPLRFVPKVKDEPLIKNEDGEEYAASEGQGLVDADDEDEEGSGTVDYRRGVTDSGIGTSFSEAGERAGVKRRRSRRGRNE
ncbi:tubulin-tyrosine ligase, partial [Diplocarpon rosae]